MSTVKTKDLNEFRNYFGDLKNRISSPLLVLFEGPLGAGKTEAIRTLVGDSSQVCSPTFGIIQNYKKAHNFYHVDLYRLKGEEDLESTGFWDLFIEDAVILVEWANLLDQRYWPHHWKRWEIKIDLLKEPIREIRFKEIQTA